MYGGIPVLKSFKIKNAYSFFDECVVDMEATNIKAHGYSLITSETNGHVPENLSLLPVLSIYGANASGKTNLLRALLFIFHSITTGQGRHIYSNIFKGFDSLDSSDSFVDDVIFEMTFLLNKNEYILSFDALMNEYYNESLCYRKNSKGKKLSIYNRKWNKKNKTWSIRIGSTIDTEVINEIEYVDSMEKSNATLLIYALSKRGNHELFLSIASWASRFMSTASPIVDNFGGTFFCTDESNPHLKVYYDDSYKEKILEFVRSMNPLIQDYIFTKDKNNEKQKMNYKLEFEYDRKPVFNEEDKIYDKLLTIFESRGVYSAMTLLPSVLLALETGGLVIADELENSLHPHLMVKVINLFTDPDINTGGGQLIFTTHNALIMDKRYLRQDEIGFVEKDDEGLSEFYKLSDVDGVRSDLDFCKNYILGAFGAIPKID